MVPLRKVTKITDAVLDIDLFGGPLGSAVRKPGFERITDALHYANA